jgi:GDP-fucose transporter C1
VLSYFVLNEGTSLPALQACVVVAVGFAIGSKGEENEVMAVLNTVAGELHLSVVGLVFGVVSSLFVALYAIYVKQKLKLVDNDSWRLLAYVRARACVCVCVCVCVW